MAEIIRMDTERLEEIGAYMRRLASALQQAQHALNGVAIGRDSGADVKVNLPSSRLNRVDSRMKSGRVDTCLASIEKTLKALAANTDSMGKSIGTFAGTFSDAELAFVQRFGSASVGSPSLLVCDQLGIDRSEWTPEVAEQVSDLISSGKLVLDNGIVLMQDGERVLIMDPSGWALQREYHQGITGERYSERIILPGSGMREEKSEFGFLTFGLLGEGISLIDQNEASYVYKNREDAGDFDSGTQLELLSFGKTGQISKSVLHGGVAGEGERWRGEVNADLFKAEVEYTGKGGFGVYIPDENGNPQLYFGGTGKIGASVCVAEVSASGEYELIDNVSIIGEGSVSALEVNTELEGKLGIVDGKLAAYGHVGLEADLLKAEGKAGVNVAGIKGQVGGAVKIGIGASASAGYTDGKFTLKVSAAMGVGVEANIELDVGEFVDNTADLVGDVVQGASKAAADFGRQFFGNLFG